jgi:hypothetical protein
MKNLFLFSVLLIVAPLANAQNNEEDHTWITGHWIGEGFGGEMEEIWSDPAPDGTMMGMFRHKTGEGEITFFEFFILDSSGMKLKHFNPDMSGWEEKNDHVTFEKIHYSSSKINLKGLTYEKLTENEILVILDMKTKSGEIKTEQFRMRRKN